MPSPPSKRNDEHADQQGTERRKRRDRCCKSKTCKSENGSNTHIGWARCEDRLAFVQPKFTQGLSSSRGRHEPDGHCAPRGSGDNRAGDAGSSLRIYGEGILLVIEELEGRRRNRKYTEGWIAVDRIQQKTDRDFGRASYFDLAEVVCNAVRKKRAGRRWAPT